MVNFEKYHFLKKEKEIFYAYHIFIEKSSFMNFMNNNIGLSNIKYMK
jgi:hypothetical protein